MNCEKCSTPMLWIGSMSRGGMDCPKCAAERPVIFDMFCKPAPEAIITHTPTSNVFDEIRAEQSKRRIEYLADLAGRITGESAWRDEDFAADAPAGEITTVATVPKDTVIDPETLRRLSDLALLSEAVRLGVIHGYSDEPVPSKLFFDAARAAGHSVISGNGYWVSVSRDDVSPFCNLLDGKRLVRGVAAANHRQARKLRESEEDARIARLTAGIPCADFHYDPDLKDTTKTKG